MQIAAKRREMGFPKRLSRIDGLSKESDTWLARATWLVITTFFLVALSQVFALEVRGTVHEGDSQSLSNLARV